MAQVYDYIFVGAGIATGATAYHLLEAEPRARVLILDRLSYYGQESTGKSASGVRDIFANPTNRQLASFSIEAYRKIHAELVGSDDFPDGLQLALNGYLWLLDEEAGQVHRQVLDDMRTEGRVEMLSIDDVRERFLPSFEPTVAREFRQLPLARILAEADVEGQGLARLADDRAYLNDIVQGVLGHGCGYLDPTALANFYFARIQEHPSVVLRFRARAEDVLQRGGQVAGVRARSAAGSQEFHAPRVILAAGAYNHDFLARRGLGHLVTPRNRMLFTFGGDAVRSLFVAGDERIPFPVIVFYHGAYFRADGDHALIGRADQLEPPPPTEGEEPPPYQQWVDDRYFDHVVHPLLAEHVPQFRRGTLKGHICGLYDYSPDRCPIIGPLPYAEGLFIIGGFSGSGIMKAHASGLLLARLLHTGEARFTHHGEVVDGSVLAVTRFSSEENWVHESFVI